MIFATVDLKKMSQLRKHTKAKALLKSLGIIPNYRVNTGIGGYF